MRWMRNAQHGGADHHPAVGKAHALQAMLGATRLSLQTRHLVRLRRSNVTTCHRPVCRCDCRPRLFGHELIAKDGRPGSGGPFCCTILTTPSTALRHERADSCLRDKGDETAGDVSGERHRSPTPSWRPHPIGRRRGLPLIGEDPHLLRESPYPLAVLIGPEASQG